MRDGSAARGGQTAGMASLLFAQPTPGSTASRLLAAALSVGRFALHFLEMLLAMYVGMLIFMALPGAMALPALLHQFGMAVSMTLPMVLWMRIRGHGSRHGIEMSADRPRAGPHRHPVFRPGP